MVRERKQLTYDANFRFSEHERIKGGWYLVSVTASPANAEKALDACRETLQALVLAESEIRVIGELLPFSYHRKQPPIGHFLHQRQRHGRKQGVAPPFRGLAEIRST